MKQNIKLQKKIRGILRDIKDERSVGIIERMRRRGWSRSSNLSVS